jgi:hopanoid-associated phosphorylase
VRIKRMPLATGVTMEILDGDAPVIAATGMDFEARIARGPGVRTIHGQRRETYLHELHALARAGARGIISFGTAGGIAPSLRPADVIVASSIVTAKRAFQTHSRWSKSLLNAIPHAQALPMFGAEAPVLSIAKKAALWNSLGVAAVDMESLPAGEVAEHYALPFVVLRVIIDPSDRSIPLSALAGVRDDGTTAAFAVLRSLMRRPGDLAGIVRLAGDARKANQALFRCRQSLGPFFGFPDLLELPLNVE